MRLRAVFFVFGVLLAVFSLGMLAPGMIDLYDGAFRGNFLAFFYTAFFGLAVGGAFIVFCRTSIRDLSRKNAILLTFILWVVGVLFCAVPFCFYTFPQGGIGIYDAIFEAASGLTATGSTVLSGLDFMDRGILLWRAILQFFGGVGIIFFIFLITPNLHKSGMLLFSSDSSGTYEHLFTRTSNIIGWVFGVYAGLALLCALGYFVCGMTPFDAICHAFTTVSSGGFSNYDASLRHFEGNFGVEAVAVIFMVATSFPLIFFVRAAKTGQVVFDSQIIWFLAILAVSWALITVYFITERGLSPIPALRYSLLNTASFMSSTGFTNYDFSSYGDFLCALFLAISYIGGCTASTSGGVKVFRVQIILKMAIHRMRSLNTKFHKPIEHQVSIRVEPVVTLLALYFVSIWVGTLVLSFSGYDFMTSLSASSSAVSNTGVGLTPEIGPSGNFAGFGDWNKMLLAVLMLAGRMEMVTFYSILLYPWVFAAESNL